MNKIAIISDIHGNLPALDAVLKDIKNQGINTVCCLGDLVGYYCFFNEAVERLEREEIPCIMGNHDYALVKNNGIINRSKTCTTILKWQLERATEKTLNFLANLKETLEITHQGKTILCTHGGLNDPIDEYLFDLNEAYLLENDFQHDILLTGHTHLISYKKFFNGKAWVNPGSVGQPRDFDNRASYAIIDENSDISFRRVSYDYKLVVAKMKELGFDDYISESLINGVKIGR